MSKSKPMFLILIALTILFVVGVIFNIHMLLIMTKPLLLPILALLYFRTTKTFSKYFFAFLILYSIAELIGALGDSIVLIPTNSLLGETSYISFFEKIVTPITIKTSEGFLINDILYFSGNTLYIIAYIFLILEIIKNMNFKAIINKFIVHILILFALDVYCVVLLTDVTFKTDILESTDQAMALVYNTIQAMELIYNIVTMLLLTAALINYLSRDSKKAMNILLGALCIVFSEVMQVAYYYITDVYMVSVLYSLLLVVAFLFFYIQRNLSYTEETIVDVDANKIEV